jgi:hypothetical protein
MPKNDEAVILPPVIISPVAIPKSVLDVPAGVILLAILI